MASKKQIEREWEKPQVQEEKPVKLNEDTGEIEKIARVIAFNINPSVVCAYRDTKGEIDRKKLVSVMESLTAGLIQFVGMYHEGRRRDFYKELAGAYEQLGMNPPPMI